MGHFTQSELQLWRQYEGFIAKPIGPAYPYKTDKIRWINGKKMHYSAKKLLLFHLISYFFPTFLLLFCIHSSYFFPTFWDQATMRPAAKVWMGKIIFERMWWAFKEIRSWGSIWKLCCNIPAYNIMCNACWSAANCIRHFYWCIWLF